MPVAEAVFIGDLVSIGQTCSVADQASQVRSFQGGASRLIFQQTFVFRTKSDSFSW